MGLWDGKVIFITGANGFLGSHLVKRALAYGGRTIALIKDDRGESLFKLDGLAAKCKVYRGDLSDYGLIDTIFRADPIYVCFHVGAQPIAEIGDVSALSTFNANIKGTWNMLEASRGRGVKAIIVASNDKVALPNLRPYDTSKSCADILSRTYARTYGLPVAVTRCVNVYGQGDFNFSRIIPDTCRSVIRARSPVIKSDGKPLKDFVFIDDITDAYFLLAGKLLDKTVSPGEFFYFCTGRPVSVLSLVKMIIAVSGKKGIVPRVLGKGGEGSAIDRRRLSPAKARKILGWRPRYTLRKGLELTYRWYEWFGG